MSTCIGVPSPRFPMSIRRIWPYSLSTLFVFAATLLLWLLRDTLSSANIPLAYLLVVLVSAVYLGIGPSLFAALISFLCFNFFLVKPYYTFHVADPRDLLTLFVFLTVATLTGQLASYAQRQARNSQLRAYELNILYELVSKFNQLSDVESVHRVLKQVLQSDLAALQVDILPQPTQPVSADQTALYLLLRAGESVFGTLRVTFDKPPTESRVRLVTACTIQASLALERIELTRHAQRSKTFEEADQLKTAILHAVSHDLRTPITIIKTSASNLLNLDASLVQNDRVEMLQAIETEADHLDKMVGNLLDISRLKAGALQINSSLNSLEEVAGDVAARVWQLTHEERITIAFPEGMPLVNFDYGLVLQALTNLVDNALRYEPPGRKVEIAGKAQSNCAQVAIINHGPNIPPEERDMIMEPFHHGQGGNIGLGLAIAKGIIEAHRGQIWVEDTPGGGATFVLTLPAPEGHAA